MSTTVHQLCARTLKNILVKTEDVHVTIPTTTGLTSRIYITIGDETVRVGSNAFLSAGIDVCIYALTEKDCVSGSEQIFKKGTHSISSMIAIIGMKIGRIQDIKIKGCSTSK